MKSNFKTIYAGVFLLLVIFLFSVTPDANAYYIPPDDPIDPPPIDPTVYPYTISGYVRNSVTGAVVSGATVKYYRSGTYIGQSSTSSIGRFRYFYSSTVPISSFTVQISKSGYQTTTRSHATSGDDCYFGTIYIVPYTVYTVTGTIKEMYSGIEIPSSTVSIYTGTTYLGQATTYSDSGDFTFSYSTLNTYTTFTAQASKPGYANAEKTVTGSGTSFNIGDIFLDTSHILVGANDFSYAPDSYIQFWDFYSDGNHETYCDNGYAHVRETSGTRVRNAYVKGHLDLSMWTGLSAIELTVRFRVTSDYSGPSSVTRVAFGLEDYNGNFDDSHLWFQSEYWTYTTDTGYITRTYTIPAANLLSDAMPESTTYDFFWGFEDAWDYNWNMHVYMDYVHVYGDSYPEGPLQKTKDVFHTEPVLDVFEFGDDDIDTIAVSYSTSMTADNTLGFLDASDTSPHLESAICIAIDPDRPNDVDYLSGIYYEWYNVVDEVTITIELNYGTVPAGGSHIVEDVEVNQALSKPESAASIIGGLMNLAAEPLGWAPFEPYGGVIKLGVNAFTFLFENAEQYEGNTLDFQGGTGSAYATFNFYNRYAGIGGLLPGDGTEDFKMKLETEVSSLTGNGIFSVTVSYDIVLKQVMTTIYEGTIGTSETFFPFHYEDHMTMIHYDDFTNIHVVHLASSEDDTHISCSADSVYNMNYPGNWKVVFSPTITVTADSSYEVIIGPNPRTFHFVGLETSFWIEDRLRLFPITTTSTTLVYTLSPNVHYYLFEAKYEISFT